MLHFQSSSKIIVKLKILIIFVEFVDINTFANNTNSRVKTYKDVRKVKYHL